MKRRHILLFVLAAVLVLTAGCGSNPPALTEQQETAIQFNQRGEAAFRRGDYAQALQEYQGALSIHRSVENVAGIATELLNLSVVDRRLGDKAAAQAALDQILTERSPAFSAACRAGAWPCPAGSTQPMITSSMSSAFSEERCSASPIAARPRSLAVNPASSP